MIYDRLGPPILKGSALLHVTTGDILVASHISLVSSDPDLIVAWLDPIECQDYYWLRHNRTSRWYKIRGCRFAEFEVIRYVELF